MNMLCFEFPNLQGIGTGEYGEKDKGTVMDE